MILKSSRVVYLIFNPELKITKIGVAANMATRLCSLRVGAGCELIIFYTTKPIINAETVEKIMHEHFKPDRKLGEWYYTDPENLKEKLISVEESFGTIDKMIARYLHGISVSQLAAENNVSRQAIIQKIKALGMSKPENEVVENNSGYNDASYCELNSEFRSGKFEKIEPNIFYSGKSYRVSIYANKKMNDRFFMTIDEAKECLKYFRECRQN